MRRVGLVETTRRLAGGQASVNDFNGQRVQTTVYKHL